MNWTRSALCPWYRNRMSIEAGRSSVSGRVRVGDSLPMKADSQRTALGSIRSVFAVLCALAPAACGWVEIPASRGGSPSVSRGSGPVDTATQPAIPPRPADGSVTVASGDSVYALARRHGVSMQSIIDANSLRPPYVLRVGQRLILPDASPAAVAAAPSSNPVISGTPPVTGVRVSELPPVGGTAPPGSPAEGAKPQQAADGIVPMVSAADAPTSAPREGMVPATEPEREAALGRNPIIATPPPASGSGFMWPINGDVIAEFGPQEKGRHNDGINIAAPRGTPVRAVESGVVAYAGNELRGFGNLLLVKHDNGWVSAYAHNGALLVQRGDTVSRGQVIARVGNSGSVATPQLHFQLRKGPRAVDPRSYLRNPVS